MPPARAIAAAPDGLAARLRWLRRQPATSIVGLFVLVQLVCIVGGLAVPESFR